MEKRVLVFASGNKHKLAEIRDLLKITDFTVESPEDYGISNFQVEEDGMTLQENALKKAKALYEIVKKPVIADDTGLFVPSLNGNPGIHSARYAGQNATDRDNRLKLLEEMKNIKGNDRTAYFMTAICLYTEDDVRYFLGKVDGTILFEERGEAGFGYDSIFLPDGYDQTFAEMGIEKKDRISHRAKALQALSTHLIRL